MFNILLNIFSTILKLFLLGSLGFFLYRKRFLNKEALDFLTRFLIDICVPSLIFSCLLKNFSFSLRPWWGVFLFWSVIIALSGFSLGFFFSPGKSRYRSDFIAAVTFQNSGYLPMNIVYFLFPPSKKDELLLFIFLYLLGFNFLMWSIGSFLIFKFKEEKFKFTSLLTPPVVAILGAFLIKIFPFKFSSFEFILTPLEMLGQMSFVLSMLVLGAGLSQIKMFSLRGKVIFDLFLVSFLKLIVIPFFIFSILFLTKIGGLFGFFLILEASMPSAVSLPLIAKWRRGDFNFSSQAVFFTHILGIFTVSFWLSLYEVFFSLG